MEAHMYAFRFLSSVNGLSPFRCEAVSVTNIDFLKKNNVIEYPTIAEVTRSLSTVIGHHSGPMSCFGHRRDDYKANRHI